MKKILSWLKKYSLGILSIVVAIFGILFAVKHERSKIRKLRLDHDIEKKKQEVARLQGSRDQVLRNEDRLASEDRALGVDAVALQAKIKELQNERKKLEEDEAKEVRSARDLSDRFNRRRRRGAGSGGKNSNGKMVARRD